MLLKILTNKHPSLRKKCYEIKEITPFICKLAGRMMKTMKANNGGGLAANQVGQHIRIIVVMDKIMINPKLIKSRGQKDFLEKCLSFPGKAVMVRRPDDISVMWTDLEGNKQLEDIAGYAATIVQHEIDHLNGITILDKKPLKN